MLAGGGPRAVALRSSLADARGCCSRYARAMSVVRTVPRSARAARARGEAAGAPAACAPAGREVLATAGGARSTCRAASSTAASGRARDAARRCARRRRLGATRIALYALAARYAGIDIAQMGVDTFASTRQDRRPAQRRDGRDGAPRRRRERRAESFIHRDRDGDHAARHARVDRLGAARSARSRRSTRSTRSTTGAERMLASSPRIAPRSLALRARR